MAAEQKVEQRITLPSSLIESIKSIACEQDIAPGHRLSGVLMMIYGYAWFEQQPAYSIDPTTIQLPTTQWLEVCGYLTQGAAAIDAIAGVKLGLSFMNQGPSAYND